MKTTYDNLFNLAELKKNIKNSEQLFWKHLPDGKDLVCNGYWIAIFKTHPEITGLLFSIFEKDCENDILRITYSGRNKEVSIANVDFGKMFPYMDYEVYDTRFSYTHKDPVSGDRLLRLFNVQNEVIAIDDRYFKAVANYEKAICEKPSRVVPIVFENMNEKFLVLPVNLRDFSADIDSLLRRIA